MNTAKCPLCDNATQNFPTDGDRTRYKCLVCGTYELSGLAECQLSASVPENDQRYLLSAYTKERSSFRITSEVLDRLGTGELRDRTAAEKIELAVRWFANKSDQFGKKLPSESAKDYPAAWCRNAEEWNELLGAAVKLNYLEFLAPNYSVTIEGYRWMDKNPGEQSPFAFVAMNFDPKYQRLRKAIVEAINKAGYRELIVDQDVFNGGIMDRVLARIWQSRFVVADYTDNRGGVYYEAGFALGLGKTVISTCNAAHLDSPEKEKRLHFDVAHLKMIRWDDDHMGAFSQNLKEHICALFGQGLVPAESS